MRSVSRLLIVLMLFATFALPVGLIHGGSGNAAALSDISIEMDIPTFAGKSQKVACTLVVSGGPAGDLGGGNFSYRAEIIGDNETGSSVFPSSGTSTTGIFKLNVTMPGEAFQTIKVKINATSKEDIITGESRYKIREYEVDIVDPILLKATVYNVGSVDAEGVVAEFYADDILLGSTTFSVPAGSSKIVMYNWTWASISNGEHLVKVVIDDPNDIVEFSDGNNVYSMTIYVGSQGNPVGAVLTVGVIIMSVLVALMVMAKPQKRK
jgi:hypothetical protein